MEWLTLRSVLECGCADWREVPGWCRGQAPCRRPDRMIDAVPRSLGRGAALAYCSHARPTRPPGGPAVARPSTRHRCYAVSATGCADGIANHVSRLPFAVVLGRCWCHRRAIGGDQASPATTGAHGVRADSADCPPCGIPALVDRPCSGSSRPAAHRRPPCVPPSGRQRHRPHHRSDDDGVRCADPGALPPDPRVELDARSQFAQNAPASAQVPAFSART